MKFKGVGAEPWKVAILAVLLLVLGYFLYANVFSSSSDEPSVGNTVRADTRPVAAPAPEVRPRPPITSSRQTLRPEFKMGSREHQQDATSIDPTLRLDLLAKVQAVNLEGGERNLFQFGAAPLPKVPEPKIVPAGPKPPLTPGMPGGGPPDPPKPPPPPPVPLKFYGYAAPDPAGAKRLFFLDGDDIVVVHEGELIKGRYKVVQTGVNSVVVEDTQFNSRETLALVEPPG
jgi:hypothetical protein